MHASNVLNKYHVHKQTGQTAYAYLHGREAPEALAEFGERVLNFVPAKPRKKLDASWLPGVYLGRALNADEYFLGTANGGVVRSRSISRVTEEARWEADLLLGVKGTPGKPKEKQGDRHSRRDIEKSSSPHH